MLAQKMVLDLAIRDFESPPPSTAMPPGSSFCCFFVFIKTIKRIADCAFLI